LRIDRDLEYALVGNRSLKLDLYLRECAAAPCTDIPSPSEPTPVIVWVHGNDMGPGNKYPTPAARLVAAGYAVASVEYRPPSETTFPAQVHDCKAAIRWLRANAQKYNLNASHIGVWGQSFGAYLASFLGTSGIVKELEGDAGNLDESSGVQAVVAFSGPADLMGKDLSDSNSNAEASYYTALIGGSLAEQRDRAKAASPSTYISADDPPFLIVHGTADKVVSPRQAEGFVTALKHAGIDATLEYVIGGGHGFIEVQTPAIAEVVTRFLDKHLRNGRALRGDLNAIFEPPSWEDPFAEEVGGLLYKSYSTPSRGPQTRANYRLYLPPGYDENQSRRYPVIYWLHGSGQDSREAVRQGWVSRLDAAIRSGITPPVIAILVQSPNDSYYADSKDGKTPAETVIVRDLIAHVDSTYRTIATREGRAIAGHSMGGFGALRIGFKFPELFGTVSTYAAAAIVDMTHPPAGRGRGEGPAIDFLRRVFDGDVEYYKASAPWAEAEKNADQIRGRVSIRMIVGDGDGVLPANQWFHEVLTRLNIPHQFVISKGADHMVREELSRLDSNPFEFYAQAFASAK
jgi:acetyl esterase/lipase/esterase/lipase superfamily enzyme